MSLAGARWLARRCPAYRRHEPDLQLLLQFPGGGSRQAVSALPAIAARNAWPTAASMATPPIRRCRRFLPSMRCPVPVQ